MQFDHLKRREFITLLGGAATWPLAARAQQAAMQMIGFLNGGARDAFAPMVTAFRQGLSEQGYEEGHNVAIEYRWAEGQFDRLPAMAADLVGRNAAVIAAFAPPAALAAKAATSTIPIVFVTGFDPIKAGLVASLNRPGGNVTGVHVFLIGLEAKRLGFLRELVPQAALMGLLVNPRSPDFEYQSKAFEAAARATGQQIVLVEAGSESEFDAAFAALVQRRVGALVTSADQFFTARREQIVALAARYAMPAIYELREYAVAGGLMSYGTSLREGYYQNGVYVGRILKGAKAADLPIVQSTKFELVINLKTAKSLGVTISDNLLSLADEVIE
jgi:putative tryptophan/tyrosine transport system substrate-binding protein